MIVVLQNTIQQTQKEEIVRFLENKGFKVKEIVGEEDTVLGAVGHAVVDIREVQLLNGVQEVIPISKPYKLASRELKKDDSVIKVGPIMIGGDRLVTIAGPCAIESREQILEAARIVKEAGAVILRGGAFKPRTSPYAFQGLGEEGLKYLKEAGESTGMPVVTEVVSPSHVEMMTDYIDIFQIGARNMQNFELLKKVGSTGMPVVLKRGLAATIEEWLMAAEYLLASGTEDVILCERGIRTFEKITRNTLDLSAIPVVKKLSHLPVIVDPSHATGIRSKVPPMALAAVAAGAHGLVIEVHPDPEKALSDGAQSLYPQQFEKLMCDIEALSPVVGKEISRLPRNQEKIVLDGSSPQKGAVLVAFQGERGAFSEKAIGQYFNEGSVQPVPCKEFKDVFEAVLKGDTSWGVVPIENSLGGPIQDNYDLLYHYPDLHFVGEVKIRIRHNLLGSDGTSLKTVKKVYSHPQALAQCRSYLEKHRFEMVPYYDTAGSAAHIAKIKDPTTASIASSKAAEVYGLNIIEDGIETNPRNFTRFAVISRTPKPENEPYDKASLVLSLHDEAGALSRLLGVFSEYGLNLTKIESRPIPGKPWSYMFYIDLEVPENKHSFEQALEKLRDYTEEYRCLGVYKASKV